MHLNYLLKMTAQLNIVWVKMHHTALFCIEAKLSLQAEQFFGYNLRSQIVEFYAILVINNG